MLVQEIISLINLEADELLDEDTDNIPYINAALELINFEIIAAGVPDLSSSIIITDGSVVPSNYVSFLPRNGYPCRRIGNVFKVDSGGSITIVYACSIPRVSVVTDTIPLSDMYVSTIVLIASYLIKKKSYIPTEYTSADYAYVQSVIAPIIKAKGGS